VEFGKNDQIVRKNPGSDSRSSITFAAKFSAMPELQFPEFSKIFPKAAEKPVSIPLPTSNGAKTRILVAEADPVVRLVLFQFLAQGGYEVVMAETGNDAIAELRKANSPPIAILESGLSGMTADEICRRMRSADKLVYLILLGQDLSITDCLEAGADTYLRKPVVENELLGHIKLGLRAIEHRRGPGEKGDPRESTRGPEWP
jgi:CheY-like chemotaxis protein